MAAPQQGQLKVWRYFTALLGIIAVLYALVWFTGTGSVKNRALPHLGLDLQGGTSMTLSAKVVNGKLDAEKLKQARDIIEQRVNATGVTESEVLIEGASNIVVNVAGQQDKEKFKQLVAPAELRFRQVVQFAPDYDPDAAKPTPTPSASASPGATPSPGASATPNAAVTPKPDASATPTPTPTPSTVPSASPSAAPSPSESPLPPSEQTKKLLESAQAKIGKTAFDLGMAYVNDPKQFEGADMAKLAETLKPWTTLKGEEVNALPIQVQFGLPMITCKQLNDRPAGAIVDEKQQVVSCQTVVDPKTKKSTSTKYLLDKSTVFGKDVSSADYTYESGGWKVTLNFTGDGQAKWTALTKLAYNDGKNAETQTGNDQVAIVLDNLVVSAPSIRGVINGTAEITGSFTQEQVSTLANQLKFGAIPVTFGIETIDDITATLGTEQLKAGLLAGGIGLALVVLYCLIYYRALGLVVIASLVASGVIVYGLVVLLGRQIGLTLSLSGIAGFIVAVGITADSFVVFFERLKDEVRDGRSVRSAVPRAWIRARRTILSADTVSFLAAGVLYVLAIGAVKGFAFTLGLSTFVDLIIVFLFTHPLVALLSRSRTFTSPKISGLGNMRDSAADAEAPQFRGAPRTKES